MDLEQDITILAQQFKQNQELLTTLGDPVRQHLILVMMKSGNHHGMRVNDIALKTDLSRPAVSHHLQIMKKAGIIGMRKEGTKNYYYFDVNLPKFDQLITLLRHTEAIMWQLPQRSDK